MDKVKKRVWIAVDEKMEFTEHSSMQLALEAAPFVLFEELEGIWQNGTYNNFAYTVNFYNREGIKVDGVAMNSWRVSNLIIGSSNFSKDRVNFDIIDPWGGSEKKYFGDRRGGIISALVFLSAASKYYSWTDYRQAEPAEREKSEVQALKEDLERLTKENNILMEKLDAIRKVITTE